MTNTDPTHNKNASQPYRDAVLHGLHKRWVRTGDLYLSGNELASFVNTFAHQVAHELNLAWSATASNANRGYTITWHAFYDWKVQEVFWVHLELHTGSGHYRADGTGTGWAHVTYNGAHRVQGVLRTPDELVDWVRERLRHWTEAAHISHALTKFSPHGVEPWWQPGLELEGPLGPPLEPVGTMEPCAGAPPVSDNETPAGTTPNPIDGPTGPVEEPADSRESAQPEPTSVQAVARVIEPTATVVQPNIPTQTETFPANYWAQLMAADARMTRVFRFF